jgi:hypothetical protein
MKYFWADSDLGEKKEPLADEDEHMQTEDEDEDMQEEQDIRYENEDVILPASLCPPAHGQDGDPWSGFVLLDLQAYFAERRNATTASCEMRGGKGIIHVTFCTAAPPLVSYFCVHYSGSLKLSHFAVQPEIVASDGGLALLRVPLGDESDSLDPDISEYFIYHAGIMGQSPTLTELPHPRPYEFLDHHTSIVRHCPNRQRHHDNHDCAHCSYTIASLCPAHTHHSYQYQLILLHKDTMAWSYETIPTNKETANSHPCTTNTINIGGKQGTVGWVDLWQGILFCDVLAAEGRRALHYVPLPPPFVEKRGVYMGPPRCCRDIAVVDGFIKCAHLQVRVVLGSSTYDGGFTSDGWSAALWSMEITDSLSEPWYLDCELDSTDLCDSLPELKVDPGTAQPTLQRLHIGQPTLSLQDDGVIYFLTKIDHRDDDRNGWVLAVDTAKKTIQSVAGFGCERTLGFELVYIASRIAEYLQATPGDTDRIYLTESALAKPVKDDHAPSKVALNFRTPPRYLVVGLICCPIY